LATTSAHGLHSSLTQSQHTTINSTALTLVDAGTATVSLKIQCPFGTDTFNTFSTDNTDNLIATFINIRQ